MTEKRSRVIPKAVRLAVLTRDKRTCQECGAGECKVPNGDTFATNLHLHHILEFENGGEHTPDNLVTLCVACHHRRDRRHKAERCRATVARKRAERLARGLLNFKEAAALLGVGPYELHGLIVAHKLTEHSIKNARERLVSKAEVLSLKVPRAEAA